jgi:hypothetical protein
MKAAVKRRQRLPYRDLADSFGDTMPEIATSFESRVARSLCRREMNRNQKLVLWVGGILTC